MELFEILDQTFWLTVALLFAGVSILMWLIKRRQAETKVIARRDLCKRAIAKAPAPLEHTQTQFLGHGAVQVEGEVPASNMVVEAIEQNDGFDEDEHFKHKAY